MWVWYNSKLYHYGFNNCLSVLLKQYHDGRTVSCIGTTSDFRWWSDKFQIISQFDRTSPTVGWILYIIMRSVAVFLPDVSVDLCKGRQQQWLTCTYLAYADSFVQLQRCFYHKPQHYYTNIPQLLTSSIRMHVHCKLYWQAMVRRPYVRPGLVRAAVEPWWLDFSWWLTIVIHAVQHTNYLWLYQTHTHGLSCCLEEYIGRCVFITMHAHHPWLVLLGHGLSE